MKINFKIHLFCAVILSLLLFTVSCKSFDKKKEISKSNKIEKEKTEAKILVFSKTLGWRHKSIPSGISALKKLGIENNWSLDFSEDSLIFNAEHL